MRRRHPGRSPGIAGSNRVLKCNALHFSLLRGRQSPFLFFIKNGDSIARFGREEGGLIVLNGTSSSRAGVVCSAGHRFGRLCGSHAS